MAGKISFSMEVGRSCENRAQAEQRAQPLSLAQPGTPAHTWMRCKMPGLNM